MMDVENYRSFLLARLAEHHARETEKRAEAQRAREEAEAQNRAYLAALYMEMPNLVD